MHSPIGAHIVKSEPHRKTQIFGVRSKIQKTSGRPAMATGEQTFMKLQLDQDTRPRVLLERALYTTKSINRFPVEGPTTGRI